MSTETKTGTVMMGGTVKIEMSVNASDTVDAGGQLGVQLLVLPLKDIISRLPIEIRKEIQFGALMAIAVDFHVDHGTEEYLSSLDVLKRNAELHNQAEAQAQH